MFIWTRNRYSILHLERTENWVKTAASLRARRKMPARSDRAGSTTYAGSAWTRQAKFTSCQSARTA